MQKFLKEIYVTIKHFTLIILCIFTGITFILLVKSVVLKSSNASLKLSENK